MIKRRQTIRPPGPAPFLGLLGLARDGTVHPQKGLGI